MTEYFYEIDTSQTKSSVIAKSDSGLSFKSEIQNDDLTEDEIEQQLKNEVDAQIESYYSTDNTGINSEV